MSPINRRCKISSDSLCVTAVPEHDRYHLEFNSRQDDGSWRTVLSTAARVGRSIWVQDRDWYCEDPWVEWTSAADPDLVRAQGFLGQASADPSGRVMTIRGTAGCHRITVTIELAGRDRLHVTVRDRISAPTETVRLGALWSHLYFMPDGRADRYAEPLDFAWLPGLHRKAEHVCADHFFRSPAVIVAGDGLYAALVPDLDLFRQHRDTPQALDLRVTGTHIEAPRLSYGICPSVLDGHVYFCQDRGNPAALATDELCYGYDLFVGTAESPQQVARNVSSYLWDRYGHRALQDARPQVLPFEEYGRRYTYVRELPALAREARVNDTDCVGLDNAHRRGANFHAWENDLNVAYGIRHYADKWDDPKLRSVADGILNLCLNAPRDEGAFPCIYNFEEQTYEGSLYWTARSADPIHGYDSAAMSVTAWWQIYWQQDLAADKRIQSALLSYGQFLTAAQLSSGAIPTYFYADLSVAKQLRESATTAISGAVLAKIAALTGRQDLKDAAVRAGSYVAGEIVPGLAFNDFETYYSCSPKPLHAIDYWSGIRPHCNLSLQWACDQMLALYDLTGDEQWLDTGEYLLSVLSLYQQVWNPSHLPGYLFGGFGVMNTDGEWNDGRQARFVPTYVDYFRATGKVEHLERAVAACRAAFALMDMRENHANDINQVLMERWPGMGYAPENIHHTGPDSPTGWTGMNWSAGGGLAAAAYLERHVGDVWVEVAGRTVVPINGVRVTDIRWEDGAVTMQIESALADLPLPYIEPQDVRVCLGNVPLTGIDMTINGITRSLRPQTVAHSISITV